MCLLSEQESGPVGITAAAQKTEVHVHTHTLKEGGSDPHFQYPLIFTVKSIEISYLLLTEGLRCLRA